MVKSKGELSDKLFFFILGDKKMFDRGKFSVFVKDESGFKTSKEYPVLAVFTNPDTFFVVNDEGDFKHVLASKCKLAQLRGSNASRTTGKILTRR